MPHRDGVSSLYLEASKSKLEAARGPPHLCVQLHNVGHLVPAKAHKARVIAGTFAWHHHIRLVVSCPLHLVWGLSLPPAGIVCGRVTPGPHVVPVEEGRTGSPWVLEASVGKHSWQSSGLSYLKVCREPASSKASSSALEVGKLRW